MFEALLLAISSNPIVALILGVVVILLQTGFVSITNFKFKKRIDKKAQESRRIADILVLKHTVLMKEHSQMVEKHAKIYSRDKILEQMNYVEQQLERGTNFLINKYSERLNMLDPKASTNPRQYGSYVAYEHSLERVNVLVRNMFRNAARENHLGSKTETEFRLYLANKLTNLRENVVKWIQSSYMDSVIPLKHVLIDLSETWPQIEETYRTSFEGMRQISIRIDKEVEMEKQLFEVKYSQFIEDMRNSVINDKNTEKGDETKNVETV